MFATYQPNGKHPQTAPASWWCFAAPPWDCPQTAWIDRALLETNDDYLGCLCCFAHRCCLSCTHYLEPVRNHQLRPRSEEHTSELQSLMRISYAVFCLKTNIQQYNEIKTLIMN